MANPTVADVIAQINRINLNMVKPIPAIIQHAQHNPSLYIDPIKYSELVKNIEVLAREGKASLGVGVASPRGPALPQNPPPRDLSGMKPPGIAQGTSSLKTPEVNRSPWVPPIEPTTGTVTSPGEPSAGESTGDQQLAPVEQKPAVVPQQQQQSTNQQQQNTNQQQLQTPQYGMNFGTDISQFGVQAPGADTLQQAQMNLAQAAAEEQGRAAQASALAAHDIAPEIMTKAGQAAADQARTQLGGAAGAGAAALAGSAAATQATQQVAPSAFQQSYGRQDMYRQREEQYGNRARDMQGRALGAQRERQNLEQMFRNDQAYNKAANSVQKEGNNASTAGTNIAAMATNQNAAENNAGNSAADAAMIAQAGSMDLATKLQTDKATEADITAWAQKNNILPPVAANLKSWLSFIKQPSPPYTPDTIKYKGENGKITLLRDAMDGKLGPPPGQAPKNSSMETQATEADRAKAQYGNTTRPPAGGKQ